MGGARWCWGMNYSAFSLSFCIFTFLFLGALELAERGPGGKGRPGWPTRPCHCSAWRDGAGFKATCVPVIIHISAPSAIRSVSSPSVPAWQAHAPSTPPRAPAPRPPCRPPSPCRPRFRDGRHEPRARFLLGERATLGVDAAFGNAR